MYPDSDRKILKIWSWLSISVNIKYRKIGKMLAQARKRKILNILASFIIISASVFLGIIFDF
jgi:hypothetical protein